MVRSERTLGLGPKHVFQKLPQINNIDEVDFDDMSGIEDVLTQRRQISSDIKILKQIIPQGTTNITPKDSTKKPIKDNTKTESKSDTKTEPIVIAPKVTQKPKQVVQALVKMDEVKKHNSPDDAWTIIHGQVFDVTNFIKGHPGGRSSIIKIMGQDGTKFFGKRLLLRQGSYKCRL